MTFKSTFLATSIGLILTSWSADTMAQSAVTTDQEAVLEVIQVTAQKRVQTLKEVPISIATLSTENLDNFLAAGDDVLSLATRIPGLYAESSNGRVAPRFYIRGLGNTDFDLAASQPVSVIMDDVVKENVILKSFPLFDIQQVEVIRGPQGTLFGRNTTAGIVKFDSVKPTEDFDGYTKIGLGSFGTTNLEGAVGGSLGDGFTGRVSVLSQTRDDWINNSYTNEENVMGGYDEKAVRAQLNYQADDFNALLSLRSRDLDGTASMFRANILSAGSNQLNSNFDRDSVSYDTPDNNPQSYENQGASLKIDYSFSDLTFTSISAIEYADGSSKGDIDGGYSDDNGMGPGIIPFGAVTEDRLKDLEQFTQEFRLASDSDGNINWQVGTFFYDASFNVTSDDGYFGASTVSHENSAWALFAQSDYKVSDAVTVTGGIRYTYDEKSLTVGEQNVNGFALVTGDASIQSYDDISVDDGQISWDLQGNYVLNDNSTLFMRLSSGFRAQTIQGRDVAFEGAPSVAAPETITSTEFGIKSDLLENSLRLNAAIYYYEIDDMQFSAIGGDGNNTRLVNADKGTGQGFEVDLEWLMNENLLVTAGFSYNDTEIQDNQLVVATCGTGMCTVTDTVDANGFAMVNGNPFPQAPETTFNLTAKYSIPMGSDGELFAFTDWAYQGNTNIFIYESKEFNSNGNFEGALRIGYENYSNQYTVAAFVRNITDEENLKGAIDFNNLTGIVNEPRVFGIEFKKQFN